MDEEITLAQILDAREYRAFRQRELLAEYQAVLICFTMNIAGPVKNSPYIRGRQDNPLYPRPSARSRKDRWFP